MINYRFTLEVFLGFTLYLSLFPLAPVYAGCVPPGTPGDDVITCTGLDVTGVDAIEGNDEVTAETGSSIEIIKINSPLDPPISAEYSATAIDAGDGEDTVTNWGSIDVETKLLYSSGASIHSLLQGISTGIGSDSVRNMSDISVLTEISSISFSLFSDIITVGIATGVDPDLIENTGNISVDFQSNIGSLGLFVIGIGAGMGDDLVTNKGIIDVTSNRGDSYGISAAEGNDTISNLGTLSVKGNSPIGINGINGIHAGEGNDTISNLGTLSVW